VKPRKQAIVNTTRRYRRASPDADRNGDDHGEQAGNEEVRITVRGGLTTVPRGVASARWTERFELETVGAAWAAVSK